MSEQITCTRCGKVLRAPAQMELSGTDGKYYLPFQLPKGHVSQGLFDFGADCVNVQLSEQVAPMSRQPEK